MGHLGDESQLPFLCLLSDRVASDTRVESALCRQRDMLARKIAGRIVDTIGNTVSWFKLRLLGRHESQDDRLVLGNVGKRRKRTRAWVIILEQIYLEVCRALYDFPQNRVISTLGEPAAVVVAAARMQREHNAWSLGHPVDHIDAFRSEERR